MDNLLTHVTKAMVRMVPVTLAKYHQAAAQKVDAHGEKPITTQELERILIVAVYSNARSSNVSFYNFFESMKCVAYFY